MMRYLIILLLLTSNVSGEGLEWKHFQNDAFPFSFESPGEHQIMLLSGMYHFSSRTKTNIKIKAIAFPRDKKPNLLKVYQETESKSKFKEYKLVYNKESLDNMNWLMATFSTKNNMYTFRVSGPYNTEKMVESVMNKLLKSLKLNEKS